MQDECFHLHLMRNAKLEKFKEIRLYLLEEEVKPLRIKFV
jgi:hypothetical protein